MGSRHAGVWLGVLLAAGVAGGVLARSANLVWQDGPKARPYAGDFVHEYASAWIVWHGDSTRLYDVAYVDAIQHDPARMGFTWDAQSVNVPYYPPPYYALIAPLAALDYRTAARCWIALQLLALAGAALLLVREHPSLVPALWWGLPAAVLFAPFATGLVSGQKGALWLLVFVGSYTALRRGRAARAGAVFGLLVLKPPLALALGSLMLARREWRFLGAAAATGSLLAAISLPLGSETWGAWLGAVFDPVDGDRSALLAKSHCWLGFSRVLLGRYAGMEVAALTLVLDALTLLAAARLWRGARPVGPRLPPAFATALLATVLVSPHLYSYDLTLLLAVFALVGAGLADGDYARPAMLRYALLVVFLLVTAVTATSRPVALLASVPGLLALQLLLAAAAPGPGAASAPAGGAGSPA